jgi:hypothetical protein
VRKPARTVPEIVNLIVDMQISLSANPPSDNRHDQRFAHRAALLNELVFACDRDKELTELYKTEDVAEMATTQLNSLSQRVYALEQQLLKNFKRGPNPKVKAK